MSRRKYEANKVLELVLEEGSDDEVDIGYEDYAILAGQKSF